MGFLNTQEILSKFFREISSISTLNGANFLTSTGRISLGEQRPSKIENPLVTINGSRVVPNSSRLEDWDLDIRVFATKLDNNTADLKRMADITGEIINRLDAAQSVITITSGKINQIYLNTDTGVREDSAHPDIVHQVTLTRASTRPNTVCLPAYRGMLARGFYNREQ